MTVVMGGGCWNSTFTKRGAHNLIAVFYILQTLGIPEMLHLLTFEHFERPSFWFCENRVDFFSSVFEKFEGEYFGQFWKFGCHCETPSFWSLFCCASSQLVLTFHDFAIFVETGWHFPFTVSWYAIFFTKMGISRFFFTLLK